MHGSGALAIKSGHRQGKKKELIVTGFELQTTKVFFKKQWENTVTKEDLPHVNTAQPRDGVAQAVVIRWISDAFPTSGSRPSFQNVVNPALTFERARWTSFPFNLLSFLTSAAL